MSDSTFTSGAEKGTDDSTFTGSADKAASADLNRERSSLPRYRRALVCGGRNYTDRDHVANMLFMLDRNHGPFEVVIHGCASGADTEAMFWAQGNGKLHAPFVADWNKNGRAAGPIRNQRMIDEGKPDVCIAFPGGRGTADMVKRALASGLPVINVQPRRKPTAPIQVGTTAKTNLADEAQQKECP